jgi:16S rRNA processing protein RimM
MASGFLNMLSYWFFLISSLLMLFSLFVESGPAMAGWTIYPPLSALPQLKDDQYYYHEVIGYQVVDKNLGDLGTVKEIYSTGAQDVVVMIYQNHEVLIPLIDAIIPKVDKKNQIVHSILPDGLLEVYTQEDAD